MNRFKRMWAWLRRIFRRTEEDKLDEMEQTLDETRLALQEMATDLNGLHAVAAGAEDELAAAERAGRPEHIQSRLRAELQSARSEIESHNRRWKLLYANMELLAEHIRIIREGADSKVLVRPDETQEQARTLYINAVRQKQALDRAQVSREATDEAFRTFDELFVSPTRGRMEAGTEMFLDEDNAATPDTVNASEA